MSDHTHDRALALSRKAVDLSENNRIRNGIYHSRLALQHAENGSHADAAAYHRHAASLQRGYLDGISGAGKAYKAQEMETGISGPFIEQNTKSDRLLRAAAIANELAAAAHEYLDSKS